MINLAQASLNNRNWSSARFVLEIPILSGLCTALCCLHCLYLAPVALALAVYRARMVSRWMVIKYLRHPENANAAKKEKAAELRWRKYSGWTEDQVRDEARIPAG